MLTRWQAGLWGIISFAVMAIIIVGLLALLDLPTVIIWGGGLFVGGLLLFRTLSAVRGSANRSSNFSTFEHNSLGEPVTEEFIPPFHREMEVSLEETIIGWHAPVLQVMNGLGDIFQGGSWGFLGKGKATNAENGLILTQKRLLFVMIGPASIRTHCPASDVTRLLDALPGDASAKRRMLWQMGAGEVRETLSALLSVGGLEQLMQNHYSFTIPLGEIRSVNCSMQKCTFVVHLPERNLQYCLKTSEELARQARQLKDLGVQVEKI